MIFSYAIRFFRWILVSPKKFGIQSFGVISKGSPFNRNCLFFMGSDLNVVRIKTVQNLIYFALRTDKCHDLWLFSSLFPLYFRFYNSFIGLLALLYSFQLYFAGSDPDITLLLSNRTLILLLHSFETQIGIIKLFCNFQITYFTYRIIKTRIR